MPLSKAAVQAEKLALKRFDDLRTAAGLAIKIFGAVTEDAVFGLYERVLESDLDEAVAAEMVRDIERARDLAKEIFGTVTPAATFEIFDAAFCEDDED